jgi:hypothetical protein
MMMSRADILAAIERWREELRKRVAACDLASCLAIAYVIQQLQKRVA